VVLFLSILVALLLPGMLAAQGGLDSSQETNFGGVSLSGGFLPDPYIFPVLSGGDVDAGAQNLGDGCRGNVTSNPDVEIEYTSPSSHLRIFFIGSADTTLIIEQPNGTYVCNDDGVGTDPVVDISSPAEGSYFVWVGTFGSTEFIPGYLMITEFSESAPGSILTNIPNFVTSFTEFDIEAPTNTTQATATPAGTTGGLNAGGTPTYGTSTLAAGFSPDPTQVSVSSGGSVDVTASVGGDCRGFAAANPDHHIDWSGSGALLRVFFVSDGDTTLVVRTPSGQFLCNDDFPGGLNPLVDIANPAAGGYDIWVGTFGSADVIPGTLYITGSNSNDPTKF
jgi:hypothetical protein